MEKPPSRPKDRSHLRAVPNPSPSPSESEAKDEEDPPIERRPEGLVESLLERAIPKVPIAVSDVSPPSSGSGARRRDRMDPWDDVEGSTPTRGAARLPIKDTKAILEEEIAARESKRQPRPGAIDTDSNDALYTQDEDSVQEAKTEPVDRAASRSRSMPRPQAPAPPTPPGAGETALARLRKKVPRWLPLAAVTFVGVIGVFSARQAISQRAVEAELMPLAGPYLAASFVMLPTSTFEDDRLSVTIDRPSCLIALATPSPRGGDIVVGRPGGTLTGKGSVAWCTCGAEDDKVAVSGSSGIRVFRAEAAEVGGDYALALLASPPHAIATPGPCAGQQLDAWIRDGKAKLRVDDGIVEAATRQKLSSNGFALVASASPELPFALVPGAKDRCFLAWSSEPKDLLTLRLATGESPLAKIAGPIGVCSEASPSLMVVRDGKGAVVVFAVAAGRVGGTHGLRETAARVAPGSLATWVSPAELAWDAAATLRADAISPPEIEVSTDGHAVGQARFVALSTSGAPVHPETDSTVAYACEPRLGPGVTDAVCAQGVGLVWKLGDSKRAGVAEAALPFWMQTFESTIHPAVLEVELDVAKLGRRLVAEGFEPTILGGTTELLGSIGIVGRPGDDAVVAVDLIRDPPRAIPCTDGPSWELLGEPRRLPLKAGAKLTLECPRGTGVSREEGHAVVFRHVIAK
jgi:hypothetical protein